MAYYDPGWHKYEPTRDEVLADAARARLRESRASWPAKLVGMLPWPLRVVLPFVAAVGFPLVVLALVFGVAAGPEAPPMVPAGRLARIPPVVPLSVEVYGSITVASSSLGYTVAPIYGITKTPFEMSGRVTVVNPTESDLLVKVSVRNEEAAGVQAAYQLVPRLVPAGASEVLPIMVRRTRLIETDDKPLVMVLTAASIPQAAP